MVNCIIFHYLDVYSELYDIQKHNERKVLYTWEDAWTRKKPFLTLVF